MIPVTPPLLSVFISIGEKNGFSCLVHHYSAITYPQCCAVSYVLYSLVERNTVYSLVFLFFFTVSQGNELESLNSLIVFYTYTSIQLSFFLMKHRNYFSFVSFYLLFYSLKMKSMFYPKGKIAIF